MQNECCYRGREIDALPDLRNAGDQDSKTVVVQIATQLSNWKIGQTQLQVERGSFGNLLKRFTFCRKDMFC